jgi:hypothetical protein
MSTLVATFVDICKLARVECSDMGDVENCKKRSYELEKNISCREKIGEFFDVKMVDGCIVLGEIIEFKVDYASSTLCNGRKSEMIYAFPLIMLYLE